MDKKYQLPVNWRASKLSDIAKVSGGKRLPKGTKLIEENTGHPYIRVLNMKETGISTKDLLYVPESAVDPIKKYRIYSGELYISVAGTLGLVGDVPKELDGANLTENANRISDIECDPRYLLYVLRSNLIQKYIRREKTISAQPKLALTRIRNFDIPLPPKYEQQKIAAILSSVDETIKKTEKIIEQTILIKNRLANQLLTIGIHHSNYKMTPIGRIPETWDFVNLSQVLTVQGGYAFKSINAVDKGIKWLKIANVGIGETKWNDKSFLPENYEDKYKAFLLKESDIVMAMTRPILNNKIKISKLSIEDTPSLLNQRVCRFIIKNNFSEDFFYHLARSRKFVNEIKLKIAGTDPPNISSKQIESIIVPMPPLEDQVKIASILNEFENKISNENDTLLYLNSLKKGLMQQLLTGKVRVPLNENEEVPQ